MKPVELEPFHEPLAALQRLLERHNNQGVIIGGVAASILGRPRFTQDVDAVFLLSVDALEDFFKIAVEEQFLPRIEGALDFARQNRVLLLTHSPSGTAVDISLGILPFEAEMVERSQLVRVSEKLGLRLPAAEDLVIMKAIAHRPKDLEDIRSIVIKNPDMDLARIKEWVTAFADALDTPEIWGDIRDLFD